MTEVRQTQSRLKSFSHKNAPTLGGPEAIHRLCDDFYGSTAFANVAFRQLVEEQKETETTAPRGRFKADPTVSRHASATFKSGDFHGIGSHGR